jgi:tRNA/tmRNA/rRNA uracil-C5-methylase (TrmA/RlmC/RlmD family)
MTLKIKQKIPLKIKKIGINGEGVGNFKGTTVFVPGALKGEDLYAEITQVERNFAIAKVLKLNKKSPTAWCRCAIFISSAEAVKLCIWLIHNSYFLSKMC